jgi:hypothetical protein
MSTNIGKLMGLINCGNCKVIDASTVPEEKDKVFSIIRKTNKYPLSIDFETLALNGYYPIRMKKLNGKDEIIFKLK